MFFDYYKSPGRDCWYYVKFAVYYVFFTAVKLFVRIVGVDTKHGSVEDNDGPHGLNDDIGYDATWIGGATSDGKWIVLAIDRRKDSKASIGYAYIKIPGVGNLASLRTTDPGDRERNGRKKLSLQDGFGFEMNEPLRKWTVYFDGKMTSVENPNVCVHVKITARWTSSAPRVWLLNRDFSVRAFAESFALERWSMFAETLFDRSSKENVVHYEQFGRLDAVVEVGGKSVTVSDAMTVRDRSFGKRRDFTNIHRYFYATVFLENGRSLVIAIVCHKTNFSRLLFGFMSNNDGTYSSVDWCDLNLYNFGENGRVVEELCFLVKINQIVREVQLLLCDGQHWYRLEKDVLRCEQTGKCLLDEQPGKCIVQSLYDETSLRSKTFCKPLSLFNGT